MLFKQAVKNFKTYLQTRDYSEATITGYRKELTYFNRWLENTYNGLVYLDDISIDDLEDYLLYRKEKGDSTASRSRIGYIFKSFFKYVAKKDLGENIALDLEPVKVRQKERSYLSPAEMEEVVTALDKPLIRVVTIFLYHTGTRIGECLDLELDDIDFKNDIIHIEQGKGNKDRDLALNSELKKELTAYLENIRPEVESPYFFATKRSGSLSRTYYNRRLKRAVHKAGIEKDITAHCIRHSTAVALVKKGIDLPTIQKVLGHANLKTTSIYVHSDMSQMREALEVI